MIVVMYFIFCLLSAPSASNSKVTKLFFDTRAVKKTEIVNRAELCLFKLRNRGFSAESKTEGKTHHSHFLRVELRDIGAKKLIACKYIVWKRFTWQTFRITEAVSRWVGNPDTNKGIQIIFKNLSPSEEANYHAGKETHRSKKPFLVVYSEERIESTDDIIYGSGHSRSSNGIQKRSTGRPKRETEQKRCHRVDLWVDTEDIGYDQFVIEPRRFNIYRCIGKCGNNMKNMTNHARMQATLHDLQPKKLPKIDPPCCAPLELDPLKFIMYDKVKYTNGTWKIVIWEKTVENLVVKTCACF